MTAFIAIVALAPFAIGLTFAILKVALAPYSIAHERVRKDGYANEWAARKGALPTTSRHRGRSF
jgi:hypothetical protein